MSLSNFETVIAMNLSLMKLCSASAAPIRKIKVAFRVLKFKMKLNS